MRAGNASETFQERFLALPCLSDPLRLALFREAAAIYREGRRRGRTIRSSTDCLIAAIAIDNGVPVWHRDRDFDAIAQYTPLRVTWDLRHVSSEESTHSATIGPSPRDNSASIVSRRLPAVATADSIAIQ